MKRISIALLLGGLLVASPSFGADEATKHAHEGAAALRKKDYKAAYDAYAAAKAIKDSDDIELGLGRALAGQGKLVEAKAAYDKAASLAAGPDKKKIEKAAADETAVFAARIGSITVTVTPASAAVTIDGVAASAGTKVPANPGDHVVSAKADGYEAQSVKATVAEGQGATATLTLAALGKITDAVPSGPVATTDQDQPMRRKYKVPAIVAYSIGGAGLIAGGVTGVLAIGKHSKLKDACGAGGHCAPSEKSNLDSYRTLGTISTIGFAVAGAGLLVGTGFLVFGGKEPAKTGLLVGPGSIGYLGRF